ncbi:hypothetical protein JHN63_15050 [Streptomyces sp. MBT65]|uniref:hypothetical protein n=1 Tax=Streptomyces sp. MBT65 TaxID=1488395 RepID=UPI00190BE8CA|nr:hypothetical protein [Streptomyces sp. MBT65]MBK3575105.1 hypothetical protein [Streptomyces sp. MBT65]
MTALEEQPAGGTGQSIQGGSQLSVDDATRDPLPQLRYADAVHAALRPIDLLPDALDVGLHIEDMNGPRELFIRLEWLPGHDDLVPDELNTAGLVVRWSHLAGWSACSGAERVGFDIDELADPATVAETAMHAVLCGLSCACEKPAPGRWEHAVYLEIALVAYDEREENGR